MKFPEKLWTMVNECKSGALKWSDDGKSVFIDYNKFENEFLGNSGVFKTKNVVSFIRQLNLYGFRKCSRFNDVHEFRNPYFVRGREDLLKCMRRKLGSWSDTFPRNYEGKKYFDSNEEEKENFALESIKLSQSTSGVPKPVPPSYYNFQDPLPYGYLPMSPYLPMSSMYALNNARASLGGHCSSVNVKKDTGDTSEDRNIQPPWGSLDTYKNVVFVPVPAEYAMYPGFYNNNFSFPYYMPKQESNESADANEE